MTNIEYCMCEVRYALELCTMNVWWWDVVSMWQLSCCQRLQCDGNLLSIVEVVCPQEVNFVAQVLLTTISKVKPIKWPCSCKQKYESF